jgi:hypothetical protein
MRRSIAGLTLLTLLFVFGLPAASSAGSISTGGVNFSSGGGMSSAAADAAYLRLDGTNDPMTGALTIPAGAAATPSFNFTGATTTGLYLSGTTLNFAHAGAQSWSFLAGAAQGPAGAVGTPTYSFLLDPDSGMYSYGANALGFTTGGVYRGGLVTSGWSAEGPGGTNYTGFTAYQRVTGTPRNYIALYSTGPTYSPSGGMPQNGNALYSDGAGGLSITSTNVTGEIRFYRGATPDKIATIDATGIVPGATNTFDLGADSNRWRTAYLTSLDVADGSVGAPAIIGGNATSGFYFSGNATQLAAGGVNVMDFPTGVGGTFAIKSATTIAAGYDLTMIGGTGQILGNNFNAADATAADMEFSSAASDGSSINIFTAANGAAEVAIYAGTSSATDAGQYLMSWCLQCSNASPIEVARLDSAGSLQLDGDLAVDGGNVGIGTAPSAGVSMSLAGTLGNGSGLAFGVVQDTTIDSSDWVAGVAISPVLDPGGTKEATALSLSADYVADAAATHTGAYGIAISTITKTGTGTFTEAVAIDVAVPTAGASNLALRASGGIKFQVIEATVPVAPVTCAVFYQGTMIYVDDTNDTAPGFMCMCGKGADDATYAWSKVNAPGTACF